ncbi:MAG: hypothetical protein GQ532_11160 [Methylomarinum sp.]|nr:hypothetical protein [Methylomarinum sp.]
MVRNRNKKQKKRGKNLVKPRIKSITLEMDGPTTINGVGIDKNGKVIALNGNKVIEPKVAHLQTGYERKKGAKVLNRTNLQKEQLISNANEALLKYDAIYAIDTNTVIISDEYFSISCIVLCNLTRTQTDIQAQYVTIQCLEFRGIAEKQENIAWVKAIQMITASSAPIYCPSKSIGLVVDSDLGNIPELTTTLIKRGLNST